MLMLCALFSYDRNDLAANRVPANEHPHNWVGPFGAWTAYGMFWIFGAAAYLVPPFLLAFGLAQFTQRLDFLNRRWPWALLLVFTCTGGLDLYPSLFETIKANLNAPSAGGYIGMMANRWVFVQFFGKPGATIILFTVYLVSFLYLTNFKLGEWLEHLRAARAAKAEVDAADEKALEKRARELEKQKKKLEEQVQKNVPASASSPFEDEAPADKVNLGADLQPVPEPTVRDLSVPQAKAGEPPVKPARGKQKEKAELTEKEMMDVGDIISAREIAAASTSDVLGKDSGLKPAAAPEVEEEAAVIAPPVNGKAQPEPEPVEAAVTVPEEPLPLPLPKPRMTAKKHKPITVASTPMIGNYKLPTLDFLQFADLNVKPTESKEELMANARLMQNTLAQFGIEVQLGDITKGPTITRYELHPAPGVKLEKITALNNNIAAALKAERINILAPVPGKSSVGVEVPNAVKTKVIMRDLLESDEWKNSKARIPLALGKDVYGQPIIADLAEMPHLLIAGSTGSGKSVCINSIIASLLYKFSPDQLRFVMIDPKVVELQQYNVLPHLVVPVVNDPKKVILALRWVVNEMEKRYQIFAKVGVRNLKSFNERPKDKPIPKAEPELPLTVNKEKVEAGADGFAVELNEEIVVPREDDIVIPEKLSYVVVIIDELADLMLVAPADVEMAIARITQMARAAGIHCIVATQRPSVDVITGVIKANIPARIAFQVAAKVDSRTILDAMGADKLLGKGDMLYLPPGSARLTRAQGVLITDQEIQSVVDSIAAQGKPSYEMEIHNALQKAPSTAATSFDSDGGSDEDEDLIEQCIEVIRSEQKASVSLLQRRLRLGYTRAARIMDELENRGIVGPSKGAEPRDILMDLDGGGADGAGQ